MEVYLSLGSNQGIREEYLGYAASALKANSRINLLKKSSIYDTAPCLDVYQPNFLNAVLMVNTNYSLSELGCLILTIESKVGRKRNLRYGPRIIDIDILLYGDLFLCEGQFSVPHQRISERAFVLVPLIEVAGNIFIPGQGRACDLLKALPKQHLTKTTLPWINALNPSFFQ